MERRFYLVDAQVLPEVFLKVVRAKELLASGEARSISAATRSVDLSRSAFYKYKDCIFDSENGREVITVMATLRDETGALQSLLAGISAAGASIVTINQSTPENGAALVAVTIRTDTMQMTPEELTEKLFEDNITMFEAGISDGEQRVRIDVALEHDISAKESKMSDMKSNTESDNETKKQLDGSESVQTTRLYHIAEQFIVNVQRVIAQDSL